MQKIKHTERDREIRTNIRESDRDRDRQRNTQIDIRTGRDRER